MDLRRKLLWIDGLAAAVAGVVVLILSSWLSEWYRLPRDLLLVLGAVNLLYASYSLPLAFRSRRRMIFILLLVSANLAWTVVCLSLAIFFSETAGPFGLVHLVGEGIFVGGLACLEWRWRELLQTA